MEVEQLRKKTIHVNQADIELVLLVLDSILSAKVNSEEDKEFQRMLTPITRVLIQLSRKGDYVIKVR